MQVALNVIIFVLGYATAIFIATHSKAIRQTIIDNALKRLRHNSGSFPPGTVATDTEKAELLSVGDTLLEPSQPSELLTKADVEDRFDQDTWQGLVYEDFKTTILAKGAGMRTFPCVYATMGYRSNDHRYVFLDSDNPSEPRNIRKLAPALIEYLTISTTLGPNTSLVIVGAPSSQPRSVEDYNNSFWQMLRGLRIWDPKPWPKDIPQDTEDAKWTFCFNGEPVFPVMLTPAHQERWSRHMSVPIIALQPKWVLDNLLGTREKRDAAQSKVRSLLTKYDTIGISPDLTSYGQAGTSEIRQLCLMDQNERVQCPYRNFDE